MTKHLFVSKFLSILAQCCIICDLFSSFGRFPFFCGLTKFLIALLATCNFPCNRVLRLPINQLSFTQNFDLGRMPSLENLTSLCGRPTVCNWYIFLLIFVSFLLYFISFFSLFFPFFLFLFSLFSSSFFLLMRFPVDYHWRVLWNLPHLVFLTLLLIHRGFPWQHMVLTNVFSTFLDAWIIWCHT